MKASETVPILIPAMRLLAALLVLSLAFKLTTATKPPVPPGCYETKCFPKGESSKCRSRNHFRHAKFPCNVFTKAEICCPRAPWYDNGGFDPN
ncbi:unnamed protein product [Caenorhabditis sp. 36 PRJEB53466]|nr:unnamed protein product [Caenorhabditis sp. 36 PRJEB53466]